MRIISQVYVGDGKFMLQLGGLSTETKPADSFVANGSQFVEDDTDAVFTFSGSWALSKNGQMKDLPVVTATDNGKILKVDNGVWSIGIDSGSSLPSMTGKNGKVLGVTLDTQEHEQIEWVTPSGGGAEKFVVTLTEENDEWTADKTVAQIVAAKTAGKECVAQLTYEYEGLDIPVEAPFAIATEIEDGGETTYVCTFSIPFVFESDTVAMLNIAGYGSNKEEWDVDFATVANPIPSYGSHENGKVLGVSDGDLAWVDNFAPLVVTMTEDQQNPGTYVGDKTFGEIKTAFEAGRNVVGIIPVLNGSVSVIQVAENNSNIAISTGNKDIAFIGAANEYPSITP